MKGQFLMQYVGEVYYLDSCIGKARREKYKRTNVTYLMKVAENEVVDPTYVGNMARLINHSCDPNCKTEKWNVRGETCIGIFAIKDIKEGEELTFNYNMDTFQTAYTECFCGAKNCIGFLGKKKIPEIDEARELSGEVIPYSDKCSICKQVGQNTDRLVKCTECHYSFHTYCLDRVLKHIPKGDWICPPCRKKK